MDGLWTAEFGSNTGMVGGGVAVFRDGKILGGDCTYFYVGEYTLSGTALRATLKLTPFIQGAESVFKTVGRDLTLELIGSLTGQDRATAQGHPIEMPQMIFGVTLVKRS
jgi:T3SS negative regulator,GrlR